MFLYTPSLYDNFRFKFSGLETIKTSRGQCLQDMFVLAVTNGMHNGTFLEIGSDHFQFINNSYLLETEFGWDGASVDVNPQSQQMYAQHRYAKFILGDATKLDYKEILENCEFFDQEKKRVSFIQLDTEPMQTTLAVLKRIPLDEWQFSVVCHEHDHYDPQSTREEADRVRQESRDIFQSHGYVLVAGNISNLDDKHEMEDWYIHGDHFSQEHIAKFMRDSDAPIAAHHYMFEGLE